MAGIFGSPDSRDVRIAKQIGVNHVIAGANLGRVRHEQYVESLQKFVAMNPFQSRALSKPNVAALIGLCLALPVPVGIAVAAFQIEPLPAWLKAWTTSGDGVRQTASSFIAMIVAFLLLPVASGITLAPALRARRAGNGLSAAWVNLSLGVAILAVFLAISGAILIDPLPCFLGRPNCGWRNALATAPRLAETRHSSHIRR